MTINSTIGHRGQELAAQPSLKEKFGAILGNRYDPVKNPDGVVNLGVAENFTMLPELTEFANHDMKLRSEDFTYDEGPWGTRRLRSAMAKHMTKYFKAHETLEADDLVFSCGLTAMCDMLAWTVCDAGDGVLLSRPIYQAFITDFSQRSQVAMQFVDFGDIDQFSKDAAKKYEETLIASEKKGIRIRALLLCNPHNPLGTCYPKETIIELMKLCDKYKIHLISDEIYATSVYDVPDKHAVAFTSTLSLDYTKYLGKDYLHVLYGMSKDFSAAGLKIGCMWTKSTELMRAVSSINVFAWVGGPSQEIAASMLEHETWLEDFLSLCRERLSARNVFTRKIMDDAGIKYHLGSNAGLFLWIDLRPYLPHVEGSTDPWDRERALAKTLMENKVFITNGEAMFAEEPGHFRVIFSQEEAFLTEGFKRIFKAIGKA